VTRFQPNTDFELQLQAQMKGTLIKAANGVRRRAEGAKHSIMPSSRSGSVVVEVDGDEVRVVNTDHGAHLDEYGSAKNPPYSPLRRSVRAAGLRLDEHGK
jgi:hypothetical protein